VTAHTRVLVDGTPALLVGDGFPVAGCPSEPQPCIDVVWSGPAGRVLVDGRPVLVAASTGLCLSVERVPQGPAVPSAVQQRVTAQ
jgi:hypothetical protein